MSDPQLWSDSDWDEFFRHCEESYDYAAVEIDAWQDIFDQDSPVRRVVGR